MEYAHKMAQEEIKRGLPGVLLNQKPLLALSEDGFWWSQRELITREVEGVYWVAP